MRATLAGAAALATGLCAASAGAAPITLNVNTTAALQAAVNRANLDALNAYTIGIAPGVYLDPNLHIGRSMTLDALVDGTVTLLGAAPLANQKGLILADGIGTHLTIDGITFQGAHIANFLGGNGAGIRDQVRGAGSGLTITDSLFVGNQEGILSGGSNGLEKVTIRNTAFRNNGNASKNTGQEHGLYINQAAAVLFDGVTVCGQVGQGHNYKVRSAFTAIINSQSYEGVAGGGCTNPGNASRGIDIPNGGLVVLYGDLLSQGAGSPNRSMMEVGAEGLSYASNAVWMIHVDFNSTVAGTGLQWFVAGAPCYFSDVNFTSNLTPVAPAGHCGIPAPAALAALAIADAAAVPEASSLAMLASMGGILGAVAGVARMRRRRRV